MKNPLKTRNVSNYGKSNLFYPRLMLLLVGLFCSGYVGLCQGSIPATDDEFVGPFSSWIDVKAYGAVGDGIADETSALQAAFNAAGSSQDGPIVVYLPAGIYRITATLTMNYKQNVSVFGADPSMTRIRWDGAAGGVMMLVSGTAYSRFNRITWEGQGTAGAAIEQSYDGSHGYFDTGNEYADNVFSNVGIGIKGGFLGNGFAETSILRCKFLNNFSAGVATGNFNALDTWIWHCLFQNCNVGVTNHYGAGNFDVYNSIFRNSFYYDIVISNTGRFSFRDNTSTNSAGFIAANFTRNPGVISIQNNTIIDPVRTTAIYIGNQGPISLLDNIIRSRDGATGPVVRIDVHPTENDLLSIGNTFCLDNPIESPGRKIVYDKVVSRESLSGLHEQSLPPTPPNLNRTVFEVPLLSYGTVIQSYIDQAALLSGTRPVVHLQHGTYFVNAPINIPAGSDVQLVGDSYGNYFPTLLQWVGTTKDDVIKINGPSKATFRDFTVYGGDLANNIILNNIDQTGARVFMEQVQLQFNENNLLVNGLDNTSVIAYNSTFTKSHGTSVKVNGGPLAASGNAQQGKTVIQAGVEFDNTLSHDVSNGGNLLIRDVWYESYGATPYLNLTGNAVFSIEGCRAASPVASAVPFIALNNFTGKAAFTNLHFDNRLELSGNTSQSKVLGLGIVSHNQNYIDNIASPSGDLRSLNCRYTDDNDSNTGSTATGDIGSADSAYLASMLETIRSTHTTVLTSLPPGVSDVRFYRVGSFGGKQGIGLSNEGSISASPNCNLQNLVSNYGTLFPSFSTSVINFTDSLAANTASISLTAITIDPSATIFINGTSATGKLTTQITLTSATNQIEILVKAADGINTKSYFVTPIIAAAGQCDDDSEPPLILTKNATLYLDENGSAVLQPSAVIQSITDNCAVNPSSVSVSPNSFSCVNIARGAVSPGNAYQAYVSNISTGNQDFYGELGLEFTVNTPSGIIINQLGVFDHEGDGINGTQEGGIRVAVFDKATHNIVDGLNTIITGDADSYTNNYRFKNIPAVTLMPGTYVIVVKGYNLYEFNGNFGAYGSSYSSGEMGGGAISFGTTAYYGNNTSSGFSFPGNTTIAEAQNAFLAGSFIYETSASTASTTVTISASDVRGNVSHSTAQVTIIDTLPPLLITKNVTLNLDANGSAVLHPSDVIQSVTDNCLLNTESYSVSPNSFSCADISADKGSSGTSYQAYVSNISTGNQDFYGELGLEFTVNAASGITIKQLGAFDHEGDGLNGTQDGGIRVAVFDKATHSIVDGLNTIVTGNADSYTNGHRFKNIPAVNLPPGTYVIVAKGYNLNEFNGNFGDYGIPYPAGETGVGAVSFGNTAYYGSNTASGFSFPENSANTGVQNAFLAGSFTFETSAHMSSKTVVVSVSDSYGNVRKANAEVTILDPGYACTSSKTATFTKEQTGTPEFSIIGKELRVFPSPTKGIFNMQMTGGTASKTLIQIFNEVGVLVESKSISSNKLNSVVNASFNLSQQPSGVYFIKVINGQSATTGKVIIQR